MLVQLFDGVVEYVLDMIMRKKLLLSLQFILLSLVRS